MVVNKVNILFNFKKEDRSAEYLGNGGGGGWMWVMEARGDGGGWRGG